jgi:hypothetical protein
METLEHHTDRAGMLLFTADGHFSVQVMYSESGAADPNPTYAKDGYEATFGSYNVDEQTHTIRQHVQAALVRTLIGKDFDAPHAIFFRRASHAAVRAV